MAVLKAAGYAKPVVLHLTGSAASEYYEGVSTVYAKACMVEALQHGTYNNVGCRVHADGRWSFPTDLTSEEALAAAEPMSMDQAILCINELSPAAVVPHMFCLPGMTTYRALCDILNIPLVGNPAWMQPWTTVPTSPRSSPSCCSTSTSARTSPRPW
eukprot:578434-Heterocapsa_arctica.AAC.2